MAVANFFDKAALGAAYALQDFDLAAFIATLEAAPVGVVFDGAGVCSPEGRITLELTVNLLARLYPRIALHSLEEEGADMVAVLAEVAAAINPEIDITYDLHGTAATVIVGESGVETGGPLVYAGSDGWVAHLSPDAPVGSGSSGNPFGAAAAACFASANVFRLLFAQYLPDGPPDDTFALSLLDLKPNAPTPINPAWVPIDVEEAFLVGVGAIGSAAVWTLARATELRGTLHLIDEEVIDTSNLQRYVLASQDDIKMAKVEVAANALAPSPIEAKPFPGRWGTFLRERANWNLERVAVAVDSAGDRIAIQAALPRWLTNAWTQPGDLGISRHQFGGPQACLACLHLPDGEQRSEDELVAAAIGLPEDAETVRTMLALGTPVGRDLLARIAAALAVPLEPLLSFEGTSLRRFYTGAICGGIVFCLGGQTPSGTAGAEVPMAFQSALAGILLAAELVGHAGQLRQTSIPTTTRLDLLRPLGTQLSIPVAQHPSGRCICQDEDYQRRFAAKYDGRN